MLLRSINIALASDRGISQSRKVFRFYLISKGRKSLVFTCSLEGAKRVRYMLTKQLSLLLTKIHLKCMLIA